MCEYFVKADPIQYEQRSRTVRIRNVLTSIRLENMVWDILAEMAEEEGCTTNALISKFHDEILAHRGEVPNFASFLRVTSMRYLRRCLTSLEKQLPQPVGKVAQMGAPGRAQVPAQGPVPKPLVAVGR
ncbi:MAG: aryl-sulfate sulfotransferase [Rhodoferax sp.]|nr:aryl-sulfate sulfotransferase [Rhodoferax sp.]